MNRSALKRLKYDGRKAHYSYLNGFGHKWKERSPWDSYVR